ncbi:DUF3298 and DUF4163 domain-containing protein [Pontibacter rugosus]|uniref:DUF3298 domain-containing protein n=1 Tax=Pontibacter rugosus TaxID=1745966 RepID=A0ABW3SWA6_9BACT
MNFKSSFSILAFALPILYLSACNQTEQKLPDQENTTVENNLVKFEGHTLERASANCNTDSATCATVSIRYPEAVAGPAAVQQSINSFIQQRLKQIMLDFNPDAAATNKGDAANQLADFFLKQHQQYTEEVIPNSGIPAATAEWELKVDAAPLYVADSVSSIYMEVYHYAGGAHGNYYRTLQSFDAKGNLLRLKELVNDTVALRKLTEAKFRQVKEGIGTKPLSEAGLFIEGNTLPFPQNAAITSEGLLLYYNPYEIGPWAFGDTEIILPYQQVNSILAEEYRNKQ